MNKISRSIIVLFVFASLVLGACAGAAPSAVGGGKPEASTTAYTGTIESISGSQWVVNGQVITVDATVVHDGPFNVGDVVKVEVEMNADGTFTVTRVEVPTQEELAQLPVSVDDNSNDASDDITDDHGGDVNSNDDSSNSSGASNGNGGNSDGSLEATGVVEAITATSITVDGVTYTLATGAEVKGPIQIGDTVKIHFQLNLDGTLTVREVTPFDASLTGVDDNGNDDSGDDSGMDDNSNDAADDDSSSNSNSNSNSDDNGGGNSGGQGGNNGSGHGGGG